MNNQITYITEQEDMLEIHAQTPVRMLVQSELVMQEARAVWEAAVLEQDREERQNDSFLSNTLRLAGCSALSCSSDERSTFCQLYNGRSCPAVCGHHRANSVLGGIRSAEPACQHDCPFHTDAARILEQVRRHNLLEASRILMQYNPMPSLTSSICPGFCTAACSRKLGSDQKHCTDFHQAASVLGKYIMAHPEIFYAVPSGDSQKKVALVGGGFCGLAAAFHLRRMGNRVSIYGDFCPSAVLPEQSGQEAASTAYEYERYLHALQHMGVQFHSMQEWDENLKSNFDRVLDTKEPEDDRSAESLLQAAARGYHMANRVNLDFGLKPYLEKAPQFTSLSCQDVIKIPDSKPSVPDFQSEEDVLSALLPAANRCMNCACYGTQASLLAAALLTLEAELCTNQRTIRCLDFYLTLHPKTLLKEGEEILTIRVPKSAEFQTGCITVGQNSEAADHTTPAALVYAFLCKGQKILDARMVLGGAAPIPVRQFDAERLLRRKTPSAELAQELTEIIVKEAVPLSENHQKLAELKTLIENIFSSI